jgi:tetratricopeptide (TPR) repeat protein
MLQEFLFPLSHNAQRILRMSLSPQAADALFEEIAQSFERGDREQAIALAVTALGQGLDEPLVLLLAAEAMEAQGRGPEGIELLRKAADYAPDEAEVWYCLGTMLIRQDRDEEGLANLKKALSLHPDLLPALTNAAAVSYRRGQLTDSAQFYQRIAALDPDNADALAALAAIAARQQDSTAAKRLATRALALQQNNVTAAMAIGRVELGDGFPENTRARMDQLLYRSDIGDDERVAILDLRAEALDKLDRTDEAFADYQTRNAILQRKYAPRMARDVAERTVDQAARLARSLSTRPRSAWQATAGPDEAGGTVGCRHIFLLSFPRSGTTLLEKVLRSHSKVVTLEEVDYLSDISSNWLADEAGLDALAQLTQEQATVHRERYWQGVQNTAGENLNGKTLIDKLPLHTLSLPVISKLFPDAKVLFALRDPRDVVLSCFRRRFQINSAMFEMLELPGAARFYHEVMNLAEIARSLLPISVHEVRHEQVVAHFEPTVQSVLSFIGLDWEPALTQFDHSLPADPRTPSDVQLRRGLNTDGLGQWRRYEAEMLPVLQTLEPWVRHFEYA